MKTGNIIHLSIATLTGLLVMLFSCKKGDNFQPVSLDDSLVCDTCLVTILNQTEDTRMEDYLNTQMEPNMPTPNQYHLLSEESSTLDSISCYERQISETSPEHAEFLLPNPAAMYTPGWVYQLPSIMSGGDEPILTGLGGSRHLALRAGAYSDTIRTGAKNHEILAGISALHQNLPPILSQNVDINIEEVYSASHAAMGFKAGGGGLFWDFATSADYSNQNFKHTFIVALRIHNFDIDVSPPNTPRDWFPTLDSTNYHVFGSYAPVYVDKVSFGKYMVMLIQTDLSKLDVESTVSGSFGGLFSDGRFDASGKYANLHQSSRIRIKTIGGDAYATAGLIAGEPNAVADYLRHISEDKTGATAAPLFVQFRFLKNNSRAKVVLASDEYIVRDCQVIPAQVMTYDSEEYHEYKVLLIGGGDGDYGGDGYPLVDAKIYLELRNNDTELWLVNNTHFYELRNNYTTGKAVNISNDLNAKLLITAPNGKKIIRLVGTEGLHNIEYNDQNHRAEAFPENGEYPTNILVKKVFINGDTGGDDLPSSRIFEDRSWMRFTLNPITVEIR